jgi:integrin alpha FG-GAP repeat containing protein 1
VLEADGIGKSRYKSSHTIASSSKIVNVIPGDFDHDGRLDLLVMSEEKEGSWWKGEKSRIRMQVHLGDEGSGFRKSSPHIQTVLMEGEDPWTLDSSTEVQGLIFDHGGSLRPSLLAFEPQESGNVLRSWHNDGSGFTVYVPYI